MCDDDYSKDDLSNGKGACNDDAFSEITRLRRNYEIKKTLPDRPFKHMP